jgi:hypothetical protein
MLRTFKLCITCTCELLFSKRAINIKAAELNLICSTDVSLKTILDHFPAAECQQQEVTLCTNQGFFNFLCNVRSKVSPVPKHHAVSWEMWRLS